MVEILEVDREGERVGIMSIGKDEDTKEGHAADGLNQDSVEVDEVTIKNEGGYAFIVNMLDVKVDLPISLTPTLRLEAATEQQIAEMKGLLVLGGLSIDYYYEHEWILVENSEVRTVHRAELLPRNRWRYYVICWSGEPSELVTFKQAGNLIEPGILCYSEVYTSGQFGTGQHMGRKFESVSIPDGYFAIPIEPIVVDSETIKEWRSALSALAALDKGTHPGISRAVETLERFNRLPLSAELRVLGYFIVLEMLLTHNPKDKEIGDSLSHQICSKVALLDSRLAKPLDYSVFGRDAKVEGIWKKLYAFRSMIAHGEVPDFGKILKSLQDAKVATAFLANATARILRHALNEPVLFDSLKPV